MLSDKFAGLHELRSGWRTNFTAEQVAHLHRISQKYEDLLEMNKQVELKQGALDAKVAKAKEQRKRLDSKALAQLNQGNLKS